MPILAGVRSIRTERELFCMGIIVKRSVIGHLSNAALIVNIGSTRSSCNFVGKLLPDLDGESILEVGHGRMAATMLASEICFKDLGFSHSVFWNMGFKGYKRMIWLKCQ